jgi:hypothetical protein
MINRFILLIVCFTFIFSIHTSAQSDKRIMGDFKDVYFPDFVKEIERNTSYKFYYNPKLLDTVKVSLHAQNITIEETLTSCFSNTEFHFAIDVNSIFITKGRQIITTLPSDFFEYSQDKSTTPVSVDISDYENKNKKKNQEEYKVYTIGSKQANLQGNSSLVGYVKNKNSGEPLIGAAVFIENPTIGVATDAFGYYSIVLPKGKHAIKIKSVGMKTSQFQVLLYGDGKLDMEVEEEVTPLKEVIVESDRDIKVSSIQMGLEKMDIKTMKQMPTMLGEVDVMKVMLALPGVQSMGEGANGINVRGGATNQNLILFNDAVVFNPSHLFGFFSTFNPDILKSVELYKSGIGAEYGGRLSSVLDVKSKDGNLKKFSGSGGISPITGRLTFEGPILKNKLSFIIGARSTYSDWLLRQVDSKELENSTASFYDLNANLSYKINEQNSLFASLYSSKDKFKLNSDTLYGYSDQNASIKWLHNFNSKLYASFTGSTSVYNYDIASSRNPLNAFELEFAVRQLNGKADFTYFANPKNTITAGLNSTYYKLWPGSQTPNGTQSLIARTELEPEQGIESAIYLGDNIELNNKASLYLGMRYSIYQYLGPRKVYEYAPDAPLEENNTIGETNYKNGDVIKTYGGLEPRLSLRYSLPRNASVKLSYNRMRQYIQMLSNTTSISPTDIWKLSDSYIKPQVGDQISLGMYKNLGKRRIEASIEAYYKTTQHTIDFKGGAVLLLNKQIETDVIDANGKAYGVELMLKKISGKLNGWISYTYSRTLLQTQGNFSSELINQGKYFPSNFDKPHAANFIGNYKFNRRVNISLNGTYSTGRPLTIPLAQYELNGSTRLYYSDRNQFRIPDYYRLDASINFDGNHKVKKFAHSSWTLAVYNLTGRKNVYSVFFVADDGKIQGYQLSVFARPIPTLTYNFKF